MTPIRLALATALAWMACGPDDANEGAGRLGEQAEQAIAERDDDERTEASEDSTECRALAGELRRRCSASDETEAACRRRIAAAVEACQDEEDEEEDRPDRDERESDEEELERGDRICRAIAGRVFRRCSDKEATESECRRRANLVAEACLDRLGDDEEVRGGGDRKEDRGRDDQTDDPRAGGSDLG
ncbi:MAG: hypothetical protein AAGD10_16290 [Myxococcota bacterium]